VKLKCIAVGVGAAILTVGPVVSLTQAVNAAEPSPAAQAASHREALLAQCAPPLQMPEAQALKLPIHVTRWGTKGPLVLLVHGGVQGKLGGGPLTFDKQEPLAKQGWRVVRVDRPGFGQSPSRGVDDQTAASVWVADMLGGGANLIGHSFGGTVSLLAAARRPAAVHSLVLVEAGAQPLLMDDPVAMNAPNVKADLANRAMMMLNARSPADYSRRLAHSLEPELTHGGIAGVLDSDPKQANQMGCALLRARSAPPEALRAAAAAVARAKIPVLVITGGWSPSTDAGGEALAKAIHGRHVIVRSPDQYVQSVNAPDFNRVVDAFMREAERARSAPRQGAKS
jgi:pimeloyl-ACP methyl ester carboxylesterase